MDNTIKNDFENFEVAELQASGVIKNFQKKFSDEVVKLAFEKAIDKEIPKEEKDGRVGNGK